VEPESCGDEVQLVLARLVVLVEVAAVVVTTDAEIARVM
jgi:hypothetical protein